MIPKVKKLAFDHIHKAAKIQFHKEVLDILDKNGLDRVLPEDPPQPSPKGKGEEFQATDGSWLMIHGARLKPLTINPLTESEFQVSPLLYGQV